MTASTTWACECPPEQATIRVIDESGAGQVCPLHAIVLVGGAEGATQQLTILVSDEIPSR